jgi:hypothetical protein
MTAGEARSNVGSSFASIAQPDPVAALDAILSEADALIR